MLSSLLIAGWLLPLTGCQPSGLDPAGIDDELEQPPAEDEPLNERQRLAKSGLYLLAPGGGGGVVPATAPDLVDALDLPAGFLGEVSVEGADVSTSVFEQWGVIGPRRGDSFAVLSTGVLGTVPEPGTDMSSAGAADDSVVLSLDLEIPEGFNRISFDYNFISAESPDFINGIYNDTFTATLIDPDGVSYELALASVNSSEFFDISEERAGGTQFDIFTFDPMGVDTDFTGGIPDAGITDFQTVTAELPAAGSWTLVFDIHDVGDGLFDSAVILDDLRIHATEWLSLNPLPPPPPQEFNEPQLVGNNGAIDDDPARLLLAGQHVRGVTADGVTQILLRTRVPEAGTVEYSLPTGTFPEDGGVGEPDAPRSGSVTVDAVEAAPGQWWTFATYTAPADFDRGTDGDLAEREVDIRAAFTPTDPTSSQYQETHPLLLRRPPVVLVHGLWDEPLSWRMPLLDDDRWQVHRAGYPSELSLATNARTVPSEAILEARLVQQADGIASTTVDLVAHGIGGLLVRQHIDSVAYLRPENFAQGDLHKFITLNTPHLGSELATASMEMWNGLGPAQGVFGNLFANNNVRIDGGAVADVQVGAPLFAALGATTVPSHAIVGTGGRFITRGEPDANGTIIDSPAVTSVNPRGMLYTFIEQRHPDRPALHADRRAFVFGETSDVFAGDHDMFCATDSQQGGLGAAATTSFASHYTDAADFDYHSLHYPAPRSDAYSDRLMELLTEPVDGLAFGSFPAPADVLPLAPAPAAPAQGPGTTPVAAMIVASGLTITSPVAGTEITPGEMLQVVVEADVGIDVAVMGVVTQSASVIIDQPIAPFVVDLAIPDEAGGDLDVLAFGFSATGELLISQVVELGATPDAELLHVHIVDRNPVLFGEGDTRSVSVLGLFDDGFDRNITSLSTGTDYLTSDPGVFTIAGDGILEATGVGLATLVARNGGLQDSVTVDVRPGLSASFELTEEWPGGYCVSLLVTNHTPVTTSDWEVEFDLGESTITESWFGVFSGDAGVVTVEPLVDWQLEIPGGTTKGYTGFCATAPLGDTVVPTVLDASATF
ncbi:MAG: cellulose binding domain-containing protein [Deltaproteobacteria bacterium]|nr:cellulose binding domain-containing protein [Deltaproteobacteria bacterium]